MKTLLALTALLTASPSLAQVVPAQGDSSGTREIVYEGDVRPGCVIASVSPVTLTNATLQARDANSATIVIAPGNFVDPRTSVPNPLSIEVALPITCNTAHVIDIKSSRGGLSNEGIQLGEGETFRSVLPLDIDLIWSGLNAGFNTADARSESLPVPGAATGAATIRISSPGGGQPLSAGTYSDTIIIEVAVAS